MYELPWFKTETNIFSNRKIQLILKLTDGDTYFRVWNTANCISSLNVITKED